MTWHAFLVAALLAGMVSGVAIRRFRLDVAILGVLLALLLVGVLEPKEAFVGFSSPAVVMVGFLYVIATGLKETGAMARIGNQILGGSRSALSAQARLVLPVAGLSAVVNNTPIVAMFLPVLGSIARRVRVPASKLFMPLSFASILGGTCTLIGTSTNVVIEGLLTDNGLGSLGFLGFAKLGLPVTAVGLLYLLLFGRRLLPDGEARTEPEQVKKYMAMVKVGEGALVGKTVEQARLRNLTGLFLSRIERADEVLTARPDTRLEAGDVLGFVGNLESVVDLHQIDGLEPANEEQRPTYSTQRQLIEAVMSHTSPLIGLTIKDAKIRTRYGVVIVAVHRHGHQLRGKLGSIVLEAGDTLLLEGTDTFLERNKDSVDFHLVAALEGTAAPRHERAPVALLLLGVLIVLLGLRVTSPVVAIMLVAALMGISRCCTAPQARRAVDWEVLIVIGSAFGIARAMAKTGLAETLAKLVLSAAQPFGTVALLAAVYLLTTILTAFITNIAAAILVFPIALSVTQATGHPFLPFAACMAVAASCEFSTPIGYQTNLMVMGPGGYRWADYTRFGGPLTILCGLVAVGLTPWLFGLS